MSVGVFDSGVGGLTVFRSVSAAFPELDLYYLGDTARVPYGNRSRETIIRYSMECAGHLINECGCSAVIVACNTASSFALEVLRERFSIPVLGVVRPGASRALSLSSAGRIGVIGTRATVRSSSYRNTLNEMNGRELDIIEKACPLFVPLVEEMLVEGEIPKLVVNSYLDEMVNDRGIDTLILGCTHYPVLKPLIQDIYPELRIVDSSEVIIEHMREAGLNGSEKGVRRLLVTDESPAFELLRNELAGDAETELIRLAQNIY
ncbi:glutamate racemase [Limisalsivibrio acetivorans]|uniref:glutamate racemase n=1 Tax=Limisalsivibrio acetivorans TaxID=1304888 RepID=UPI0003B5F221|nr:glutamate racemase [Limisalsivibrio acetivorans]